MKKRILIAALAGIVLTGCSKEEKISDLKGNITISPNENVEVGMEITANYNGTEEVIYRWNKNGAAIGSAVTNKYTTQEAGTYTVPLAQ